MIQNFHVARNDGHNFKINFNWSISVRPCEANIQLFGFDFVPFDDILAMKVTEEYLIGNYNEITGLCVITFPITELMTTTNNPVTVNFNCEGSLMCHAFAKGNACGSIIDIIKAN